MVSIFDLVFIILRDHHKLVTKGFLHCFVADRGFSLGLKKMALGLRTITPYIALNVTKRIKREQKSKPKNSFDKINKLNRKSLKPNF